MTKKKNPADLVRNIRLAQELANPTQQNVRKIKNKIAAKRLRDFKREQFHQLTQELENANSTITFLQDALRNSQAQLNEAKYKLLRFDADTPLATPTTSEENKNEAPLTAELDVSELLFQDGTELMLISTDGPIMWPETFPILD